MDNSNSKLNLVWVANKAKNQSPTNIKAFRIAPDNTFEYYNVKNDSSKLKWSILKEFNVKENYGIRLRNQNGRLVPVNDQIRPNSREAPYFLELFVPAVRGRGDDGEDGAEFIGNKVELDAEMNRVSSEQAAKNIISSYRKRIEHLENALCSKDKRNNLQQQNTPKVDHKLNAIQERLNFIERRLKDVKYVKWTGEMPKKPLLW